LISHISGLPTFEFCKLAIIEYLIMKRPTYYFFVALINCIALLQCVPAYANVLFSDSFESGTLNGPFWLGSDSTSVSVSTDRASSGAYSAKFTFAGSSSLDADAFAELRFSLGKVYPELWVKYKMYIPSNYKHRNANGSDNNKMIRLWGISYNDWEKVGACTWPNSAYSLLQGDWDWPKKGLIGPYGEEYANFIDANDLGKWVEVIVHAKAATATQKGTLQFWKNGTLIINNLGTVDNYYEGGAHGYRYGYLLGWANSGFTQTTYIYIDDVVFGTQKSDISGGTVTPLNPPTSLRVVQ
jgi:polysaccharide lyase-like protein